MIGRIERTYTVYKHTSPEGKTYIGCTCARPREIYLRWKYGNGYKYNACFWEDIQRFGWSNFKHEILETGLTREEARSRELFYMDEHQSDNPDRGYNRRRVSILPRVERTREKELARAQKIRESHRKRKEGR